jgi:hypothetical protein
VPLSVNGGEIVRGIVNEARKIGNGKAAQTRKLLVGRYAKAHIRFLVS